MSSGIGSLHRILKDETRRRIIVLLHQKGCLSYMDLMKSLGVTNTGKMNYHLKVLGDLLSKKADGQYSLSEKGALAFRLLQEFSETNTSRQLSLSSKKPQIRWGGVIILIFVLIGWYDLSGFLHSELLSGYATDVEPFAASFFLCAVFSFISLYMIISDLKNNSRLNLKLGKLARNVIIVLIIAAAVLGIILLGVSVTFPNSVEHLAEVDHQNNPGSSFTVFSNESSVYRADLVISDTSKINLRTFNLSVTIFHENQTYTLGYGNVEGNTLQEYFPTEPGQNTLNWDGLNVTQITVYIRTGVSPDTSRLSLWTVGLLVFLVAAVSLLGFWVNNFFQGERSGVFWWGLIIFGLALSWLFLVLWSTLFPGASYADFLTNIAQILVSLAFLFAAFRMMKVGTASKSQTYSASQSRMSTLMFYLSERNYRAFVYLLASTLLVILSSIPSYFNIFTEIVRYLNILGALLLFAVFGLYPNYTYPAVILAYALLIFGLFVEIFLICEFFINQTTQTRKTGNREP